MARFTPAERMARTRARRRRGRLLATVEIGPIEFRKLAALGYLDAEAPRKKGATPTRR
jgi:hypothetical protein